METDDQIIASFPEITPFVNDPAVCYRWKYSNDRIKDLHAKFMNERGWKSTNTFRFNSGNGLIEIWEKIKKNDQEVIS